MTYRATTKLRVKEYYSIIAFNYVAPISSKCTLSKDAELESAQNDQEKIGKASSDPETAGPAENLHEEAAEITDEDEDSEEAA